MNDHPLFHHYPLVGRRHLSTGDAPVPYHVYNGHGLFIGGVADLAVARERLRGERLTPLETTAQQALAGVWVCDFADASLGAHHELQFSVFVTRRSLPPLPARSLILLREMLLNADLRLLCWRLWNNTPPVVAYNNEVLGLPARLTNSLIQRSLSAQLKIFSFSDADTEQLICKGQVTEKTRTPFKAGNALLRILGWATARSAAARPWITSQVTNPIGHLPVNADAQAYLAADRTVLQLFNPRHDRIEFVAEVDRAWQFRPLFLQHFSGLKFVYLNPHNLGETVWP